MMRKAICLCMLGLSVVSGQGDFAPQNGSPVLEDLLESVKSKARAIRKAVKNVYLDEDREDGLALVVKLENGRTKTIELGELPEFKELKTKNCGYRSRNGSKFDAVLTGCRGEKRFLTIGGLGVWTFNRGGRAKQYVDKHPWEDQAWKPPVLDDEFMKEQLAKAEHFRRMEPAEKLLRRMDAPVKRDAFEMKIRYYYENSFLTNACNGDHDCATATILEIHAHTAVYMRHTSIGRRIFLKYNGKPTYVDATIDAPSLNPFESWLYKNVHGDCDPTVGNHHLISWKDSDLYKGVADQGGVCNPDCKWNNAITEHGWGGGVAGTAGTVAHELGHTLGMHHTSTYEYSRPSCKGFMTYNEHPNVWSECNKEMYEWTYEENSSYYGQDKMDKCLVPTDPEEAIVWSPKVEIPCEPEMWIGHKKTCGECSALVDVYENGRTCHEYCERQGLYCVDAWDDEDNNECSMGATRLGCNFDFALLKTSDGICQCSQSADAMVDDFTIQTWAPETPDPTAAPTKVPVAAQVAATPHLMMTSATSTTSATSSGSKDCHTKLILESPTHTCDARLLRKQDNSNEADCAERCGNDPLCTHFALNQKGVCKLFDSCDITTSSKNMWDNYEMTDCLEDLVVGNEGATVVTTQAETPVAVDTYSMDTYGAAMPTTTYGAAMPTSIEVVPTAIQQEAEEPIMPASAGVKMMTPMTATTSYEMSDTDATEPAAEDCYTRLVFDSPTLVCNGRELRKNDNSNVEECAERCGKDALCTHFALNQKNVCKLYASCDTTSYSKNAWDVYKMHDCSEEIHVIEDEGGLFTAEDTPVEDTVDEGHVIESEGGYFMDHPVEEPAMIEPEIPITFMEPVTTEQPIATEAPVATKAPEQPVSGCPTEQQLMELPADSARTVCENAGCVYTVDMSDPFTTKRYCTEEAPEMPTMNQKMVRTAMEMPAPAPAPSPVTEEPVVVTTATTATPTTVTTAAAPVPEGPCYTKVPLASENHTCSEKNIVKLEPSSEEECAQACYDNPECMYFTVNKSQNVCKTYWTCNETKATKHVWDVFQMDECA